MKIRFYNARILTMEEGREIFLGEVHIDDSRISYVGEAKETTETKWDQEIDCEGNLLMPGFKNAHTHSAMTFLRSHADDLPLGDWLENQVFPFEAKLTPEDIYTFTKLAVLEYLTSGITSIMEMYLTPETVAKACQKMGMRLVQVGGVNNFSQSPELLEKWYKELNGVSPLTSFCLGFHAEYTCTPELLQKIADLARKYKAPVFTHCEETEAETLGCIERYGKTPVKLLSDLGMFDYGGAGFHMVHANKEDIQILKEKHIGVVTNPASNTKLASGIAPLDEFLENDVLVALGTDGPASNNCLDMFREMFLATGLAKLRLSDASAIPAMEVLKMATVNGAHLMQIPDADVLAEGKLADLIMIDLFQPNMQPIHNIAKNIVYSGSKQNVKMTMIHGRILYDCFGGGQHFHTDSQPAEIYREAQKITERIFA